MPQYYDNEFKKKIVRLKLEEGGTAKSMGISQYGPVDKLTFSLSISACFLSSHKAARNSMNILRW